VCLLSVSDVLTSAALPRHCMLVILPPSQFPSSHVTVTVTSPVTRDVSSAVSHHSTHIVQWRGDAVYSVGLDQRRTALWCLQMAF